MKKEEIELLLKDICARFPYGIKVQIKYYDDVWKLQSIYTDGTAFVTRDIEYHIEIYVEDCKPFLFPLSSMTEEQKYDFYCRFIENDCDFDDFKEFYLENNEWHKMLTSIDDIEEIIDWFNKYHFDFRCLIPMGLAIDATDKNIY